MSQFNRKQFHHIHPKAYLKRSGNKEDENVLANICMLSAAEDHAVSDIDPKVYLPASILRHGLAAKAVLVANLMRLPADHTYATATYAEFIRDRSELIASFVAELCEGNPH